MVQTSFAERLQRIENAQGRPAADRLLAGISEAALSQNAGCQTKARAARRAATPGSGKLVRLVAGFVLIYCCALITSSLGEIQGLLEASAELASYKTAVMGAVAVSVIAVFIFFAVKLQRAAFRVMSEPWRLPFAIGMVMGLAVGFAPPDVSYDVLAQLH